MPVCGTRYRLKLRVIGQPERVLVAHALYREVRDPDKDGQPGRLVSRRLVHALLNGAPVWVLHDSLEEAVGSPFVVLEHERVDGPRWSDRG